MEKAKSCIILESVKTDSYAKRVYDQIKTKILQNEVETGSVLNERDLATQLNVSRTPIRDALNMLERDGWIRQEGRKRIVCMLSHKEIQDLINLRWLFEPMAFDFMMDRTEPPSLAGIKKALKVMGDLQYRSDDLECRWELYHADIEFHREIAKLSGNMEYIRLYQSYSERLMYTFFAINSPVNEYFDIHRPIVLALERGDYSKAKEECVHMLKGFQRNADYLFSNVSTNTID